MALPYVQNREDFGRETNVFIFNAPSVGIDLQAVTPIQEALMILKGWQLGFFIEVWDAPSLIEEYTREQAGLGQGKLEDLNFAQDLQRKSFRVDVSSKGERAFV